MMTKPRIFGGAQWVHHGSTDDVRHADPVTMTWKALSVSPSALLAWPVDLGMNHSHICN